LDVWDHTRLVVSNCGPGDLHLLLGALLHDVGKPATRFVDEQGNTRFFGHESVGAGMTNEMLRRLRFSQGDIEVVALLVGNHMRLGSSPTFSPTAARRLLRDMGDQCDRLLDLVEADAASLHPGVRCLDLRPIRARLAEVMVQTPRDTLQSPLSGTEIMALTGLTQGVEVGRIKAELEELVLEGKLLPDDKDAARTWVNASLGIE
jgi:putative nucleotidyltransferase with HDIG domain